MDCSSLEKALKEIDEVPVAPSSDGQKKQPAAVDSSASASGTKPTGAHSLSETFQLPKTTEQSMKKKEFRMRDSLLRKQTAQHFEDHENNFVHFMSNSREECRAMRRTIEKINSRRAIELESQPASEAGQSSPEYTQSVQALVRELEDFERRMREQADSYLQKKRRIGYEYQVVRNKLKKEYQFDKSGK